MTRSFKQQRGFLTFAQNGKIDYVRMAYALALSLKATNNMPLSIAITPGTEISEKYRLVFDEVIDIFGNDEAANHEWKLQNEWKAFHLTPYQETIKLDADMLFTTNISEWWDMLSMEDFYPCKTVETYRGEIVISDVYRKCFTANKLPNIYTGFMYFRTNDSCLELFDLAQTIYQNWQLYYGEFLEPLTRPTYVSTDVVFALSAKILGLETPSWIIPSFVHMKSKLQNWPQYISDDEDWMKHVPVTLTDDLILKIGRYRQYLPIHYHQKDFLTDKIISTYERHLGI